MAKAIYVTAKVVPVRDSGINASLEAIREAIESEAQMEPSSISVEAGNGEESEYSLDWEIASVEVKEA